MRTSSYAVAATLVLALGATGCATTLVQATPQRDQEQDVVYKNGVPIVYSRLAHSDVAVAPNGGPTGRYALGKRVPFFVFVRNRSDSRILVSEDSVTVRAATESGNVEARVMRATEVEDEIHQDAAWARAVNAFAFAASTLSTQGTSYTPAAANQARREAARDASERAERIDRNEQAALSRVSELLQSNTLESGESASGGILFERPSVTGCERASGEPFRCAILITVEAAGDLHRFMFVETR